MSRRFVYPISHRAGLHRDALTLVELSAVSGRKRDGFTLVELLVVIGIIALLIGILLPTLAAARESSMGLKSLSNLRQLATGLDMYKVENKGFYPRHSSIAAETTGLPAGNRKPRTRW